MMDKIQIGISACLMGENVRYNGGNKRFDFALDELSAYADFQLVCPEMAIGLGIPRPTIRLIKSNNDVVMRFTDDNVDLTETMQTFSKKQVAALHHLSGYIVCAKSPSCGMERVKVYEENSNYARKEGVGLYTAELMKKLPWLPVEEDGRLHDNAIRENFIERVFALNELNKLQERGLTRAKLIDFHSRYKYTLLAHSQAKYREIGRFVASIAEWDSLQQYFIEYRNQFMALLSCKATRANHTNVLMHIQGYFKKQLTAKQRQELTQLIDLYRQGIQPLLAPITLLKHYLAEHPDQYLLQQSYFNPYPEALRLRYGF
ncbi:YbgA family protein [Entomomonas asaccharolytica]|uniref:DUF1722 domain-containing protein n=1 Tax=Entomomonas asaccharolytica TaxID=2785331 RepID=A0A974NFH7_9GAMM|nr:2-thiouracil desulfurase family protein [Entomomonas asaccharolytica]QQP85615.1 DUF1722 domain-containing protein [Entomomonas asaccharolytica]